MFSRANVKQNTRSLDLNGRLTGFEDRQPTPAEEVKVPCRLCRMIKIKHYIRVMALQAGR